MALTRVQATGTVSGSGSSFTLPLAAPPTLGHGIVVTFSIRSAATITVSDTYSNVYTLVGTVANGTRMVWMYACGRVVTTGSGFTISVSFGGTVYHAAAIEVGGVGAGGLMVDRTATQTGSTTAVTTGTTDGLTGTEGFAVCGFCVGAVQGAITVESVSPSWTQEYKSLGISATAAEGDSRVLTGAVGTTQSGSWTLSGAAVWAAMMAVFTTNPAVPPTGLARVQGTGRVRALNASVVITFVAPPTVGHAIVVLASTKQPSDLTAGGCTDNRGHTYALAITLRNSTLNASIFYCPIITASAAPFTITVAVTGGGYWEAAAVEVRGVGTGLVVDQTVSQTGTGATPTTGVSPAVAAAEVVVAAVLAAGADQASLTVDVVSPAWIQEYDNLSLTTSIAGEGDTRVRPSAAGTTQSATWTLGTSTTYAAALAAFAASGAPAAVERVEPFVWGPL